MNANRQPLTLAIYALTLLMGAAAFAAPFVLPPQLAAADGVAPLLTTLLIALSLTALLVEMQGQVVSAKIVAALGILVAISAVLRFIEVAIPGPGGFSPIFVPIILAGYVFGARFGFLMGTMTLLVSALVTGGVGPWLPFQMFTAGWIGLASGWLPHPPGAGARREMALLLAWSMGWGILYGAIINLYTWPLLVGTAVTGWQPELSLGETIARYAAFYAATSLLWDVGRAIGNAALLLVLGPPAIRALTRFRRRLRFEVKEIG